MIQRTARRGAAVTLVAVSLGIVAAECSSAPAPPSGTRPTAPSSPATPPRPPPPPPSSSATTTSTTSPPKTGSSGTGFAATVTSPGAINPAAVPLGDGYLSTSPKVGSVDTCTTLFPPNGGAQSDGPWLDTTAHTWNSSTKLHVEGSVNWPAAHYQVTESDGRRVIVTNDLPIDHTTGTFPISPSDPAYAYDRNPNHIVPQSVTWSLPLDPTPAHTPGCLNGGPIGVLDDGVLLFDALDGEGRDAGAHEVLDACGEHPQQQGVLHHHFVPSCILDQATGRSTLVGYAIDGYGIYVERSASGALLTNTDLDACHGRVSPVLWDGKVQDIFHYDATLEYPYTVGCYHGTPIDAGQG